MYSKIVQFTFIQQLEIFHFIAKQSIGKLNMGEIPILYWARLNEWIFIQHIYLYSRCCFYCLLGAKIVTILGVGKLRWTRQTFLFWMCLHSEQCSLIGQCFAFQQQIRNYSPSTFDRKNYFWLRSTFRMNPVGGNNEWYIGFCVSLLNSFPDCNNWGCVIV